MCGRFNLTAPGDLIAEEFGLDEAPVLKPRFNIAPSQPIATIGVQPRTGRRGLAERCWGFVARRRARTAPGARCHGSFADLAERAQRPAERRHINARSETAARSPAFREAFARRRCLIPATGFYEWRRAPGSRPQPWLFQMADGRPFAFAGLWEPAHASGAPPSCLILTTEPNDLAREVHDRMPAILAARGLRRVAGPGHHERHAAPAAAARLPRAGDERLPREHGRQQSGRRRSFLHRARPARPPLRR